MMRTELNTLLDADTEALRMRAAALCELEWLDRKHLSFTKAAAERRVAARNAQDLLDVDGRDAEQRARDAEHCVAARVARAKLCDAMSLLYKLDASITTIQVLKPQATNARL